MTVIRLTSPAGVARVLDGAIGQTFIVHRFTDGAKDSVGKIDGKLKGAASVAGGKLVLKNENMTSTDEKLSYLEFPEPILPKERSVSLVCAELPLLLAALKLVGKKMMPSGVAIGWLLLPAGTKSWLSVLPSE